MSTVALDITANTSSHALSESEASLQEIDFAYKLAIDSIQADALDAAKGGEAVPARDLIYTNPADLDETQKADRIKLLAKRAATQRVRGRSELEKVYAGAMSVELQLSWNDLQVAASCERYLGLCDLMPYTLGRRGPSVLGSKGTTTVLEQFSALVENYHAKGKEALHEAKTLHDFEYEKILSEDEWVKPAYVKAAFAMAINAKHRGTPRIVNGMKMWDEAIRLASILEWNGKIEAAKIADIRDEHRKAIRSMFIFARRSIVGLLNGTLRATEKKTSTTEEVSGTAIAATPELATA